MTTTTLSPRSKRRWWPLLLALAALALLASQMPTLWRYAVATTLSLHAQDKARQWQTETRWTPPGQRSREPSLEDWSLASLNIEQAIAIHPTNAQLHETLALLHINRLLWHSPQVEEARAALERAHELLERANQLRPMSGHTWAAQALALFGLDTDPTNTERRAALWKAFDQAMAYGQSNGNVQQTLAQIAFARWNELSPERQQAVRHMVAQATQSQRKRINDIASSHGLRPF